MADQDAPGSAQGQWFDFVEEMNEQFVDAMEANARAQAEFVESWSEALESLSGEGYLVEGIESYGRAYSSWMDAAKETAEKTAEVAAGNEVSPEEFRDIWLDAANEAFKEVTSTDAFAAITGHTVEDALELRRAADESAQATLHELGFATEGDVREVAERLVELERRQKRVEREVEGIQEVERKLDRVLDQLEG